MTGVLGTPYSELGQIVLGSPPGGEVEASLVASAVLTAVSVRPESVAPAGQPSSGIVGTPTWGFTRQAGRYLDRYPLPALNVEATADATLPAWDSSAAADVQPPLPVAFLRALRPQPKPTLALHSAEFAALASVVVADNPRVTHLAYAWVPPPSVEPDASALTEPTEVGYGWVQPSPWQSVSQVEQPQPVVVNVVVEPPALTSSARAEEVWRFDDSARRYLDATGWTSNAAFEAAASVTTRAPREVVAELRVEASLPAASAVARVSLKQRGGRSATTPISDPPRDEKAAGSLSTVLFVGSASGDIEPVVVEAHMQDVVPQVLDARFRVPREQSVGAAYSIWLPPSAGASGWIDVPSDNDEEEALFVLGMPV